MCLCLRCAIEHVDYLPGSTICPSKSNVRRYLRLLEVWRDILINSTIGYPSSMWLFNGAISRHVPGLPFREGSVIATGTRPKDALWIDHNKITQFKVDYSDIDIVLHQISKFWLKSWREGVWTFEMLSLAMRMTKSFCSQSPKFPDAPTRATTAIFNANCKHKGTFRYSRPPNARCGTSRIMTWIFDLKIKVEFNWELKNDQISKD